MLVFLVAVTSTRAATPRFGVLSLLLAAQWLAAPVITAAQTPAAAPPDAAAQRPRVGLVLSGGGARGAAHIGVLKVLEEMRVPVDAIAGTSMGAVVGGLYASGLSARDIEKIMTSINWQDAFSDRPPREDLTLRRKEEEENFLVNFPLGLRGGHIVLPRGLIQGQRLTQTLRRLTLPVARISNFDELPTAFRAVATDLETGDSVVIGSGDLTTAMRASLSAPGVFAPVQREGRMLVDGGIADNVPVDIARAMGVDLVIVVDVGFPLQSRRQLTSAPAISNQMLAILMRQNAAAQLATLTPRDILIQPPLGDASSFDFGGVAKVIGVGESAARARREQLAALTISERDMRGYLARRESGRQPPPRVEFVQVDPESEAYGPATANLFSDLVGKPLDPDAVARRVTALYGRGGLDTLDYHVIGDPGRYGLSLDARPNSQGPNYLRFGLSLQDDLQGNSTYDAALRFVVSDITRNAGEWVTDLQVGTTSLASTELFLPLTQNYDWFVMPHVADAARDLFVLKGQTLEAEYRVHTFDYGVDFGRQFGNWGEIRTGVLREQGHYVLQIGDAADPNLPEQSFTPFNMRRILPAFHLRPARRRQLPAQRPAGHAAMERRSQRHRCGAERRPGHRQLSRRLFARARHAVVLCLRRHDAAVAHHRSESAVSPRRFPQPVGAAGLFAARSGLRHCARALLPADRARRSRLLRRADLHRHVAGDRQRLADPQRGEFRQHAEGRERISRAQHLSRPGLHRHRLRRPR